MRTPQRVDQFKKEVEAKRAKAARADLLRRQEAPGSNAPKEEKSIKEIVPIDHTPVLAEPEEVISPPAEASEPLSDSSDPVVSATDSADSATPTSTRKRKS